MKKFFAFCFFAMAVAAGVDACSPDKGPVNDAPAEIPGKPEAPVRPDEPEPEPTPAPEPAEGKTLIVYYSFTNNVHAIVEDLRTQISADVIRVEPAEKGIDYAANNYAVGSSQIQAIRDNPGSASSYPAIDPVDVDFGQYGTVFVATPLWWSNMAAPMQSFLFAHGAEMAGKRIGLIVSSASSGISGVESDSRRLIPDGNFMSQSLWIRSSQTSGCHSMTANWLEKMSL